MNGNSLNGEKARKSKPETSIPRSHLKGNKCKWHVTVTGDKYHPFRNRETTKAEIKVSFKIYRCFFPDSCYTALLKLESNEMEEKHLHIRNEQPIKSPEILFLSNWRQYFLNVRKHELG